MVRGERCLTTLKWDGMKQKLFTKEQAGQVYSTSLSVLKETSRHDEVDAILGTNNPTQVKSDFERLSDKFFSGLSAPKKKKSYQSTEKQTQQQILQWLRAMRIFHWRQSSEGRYRITGPDTAILASSLAPGCPDIIGLFPNGRAFFIEVKDAKWVSPGEDAFERAHRDWLKTGKDRYKTERAQAIFQNNAAKNGALVIIARTLSDVTRAIEGHLREIKCPECYKGPLQG